MVFIRIEKFVKALYIAEIGTFTSVAEEGSSDSRSYLNRIYTVTLSGCEVLARLME